MYLLPECDLVKLFLKGSVLAAFTDPVGLWMAGFGLGVVDIFNGKVKFILVMVQRATELRATIG